MLSLSEYFMTKKQLVSQALSKRIHAFGKKKDYSRKRESFKVLLGKNIIKVRRHANLLEGEI